MSVNKLTKRPSSTLAGLLMLAGGIMIAYGVLYIFGQMPNNIMDGIVVVVGGLVVAGVGGIISWLVEAVHELRLARAQLDELSSDQPSPPSLGT